VLNYAYINMPMTGTPLHTVRRKSGFDDALAIYECRHEAIGDR
jgi:hypothetical protein